MEYIKLISQTLLDSSAMFLLCNYLSNKRIEKSNKNLSWIIFLNLVYIFSRWSVLVTDNYIQPTVDFIGFDILPVNSLYGTFLLCIFLMIANSIYLKMENSQAFFATIASIIIWVFIRILAVVPFKLISVQNDDRTKIIKCEYVCSKLRDENKQYSLIICKKDRVDEVWNGYIKDYYDMNNEDLNKLVLDKDRLFEKYELNLSKVSTLIK